MKLFKLKQEWGEIRLENLVGRITIPVLAITLLVAVLFVVNTKPVITVLPPNMTEKAEIAFDDANDSTKKAYGLYVVETMGNVHPGTVGFLTKALDTVLHPSIYHEVKQEVMDQVQLIQQEDLAIRFEARSVDFWSDTNRVVVHGNRVTEGRGHETMAERVTYEVEVEIHNYMPTVTYVSVYDGRPQRQR